MSTATSLNPVEMQKAAVLELCRRNLLGFVKYTYPAYHISAAHRFLAGKLEQFERDVRDKKSPRLMVTLPPASGRVSFPAGAIPRGFWGGTQTGTTGLSATVRSSLKNSARTLGGLF